MSATPKVLLFKGGDCISWLVKVQSRSQYSHAALLLPNGRCLESYPGKGVRTRDLTSEDWARIDAFDVQGITEEQWAHAAAFALSQLGMPYDWVSVLRFVDKLPARDNGRWFCSELVFKAIAEGGIRLLERITSAEVSPQHLAVSPLLIPVTYFNPEILKHAEA